jgi:fatty-acyl-CoA synthase
MPLLHGLMQRWPLTTDRIVDHAARWHGDREIVSRTEDGVINRRTYADLRDDAARCSNALLAHGIGPGDRVATLAMNGGAHLAAWYAISGIGAVCHTLNPRYSDDQLCYIINHAADRLLIADGSLAALVGRLLPHCPTIERVVFLSAATEPVAGAVGFDAFVAGHSADCQWGGFDEETAAGLCYTSGTTGHPKGVLYSHRSNFLHTLMTIQPDMFGLSARDCVMPVVPMYHANAWGMTFSAPCVGAKLVLPGARLDGPSLATLIADEGVTVAAGVPTVWLGLIEHLRDTGTRLPSLTRVIVGGAMLSEALLRGFAALGIEAIHAWGMTELSPCGGAAMPTARTAALSTEEQLPFLLKQGRSPCGIEMRLVDDEGSELPHDGRSVGALQLRGPAVARGYYGQRGDALDAQGYFDSGDLATIDSDGFMRISDRAKDIIKSGGEWISSVEIENAALNHPAVTMAAAIAIPHDKWGERPLLFIQLAAGQGSVPPDLAQMLADRLPRMWCPDAIRTIAAMPLGSTGKIDKKALRNL